MRGLSLGLAAARDEPPDSGPCQPAPHARASLPMMVHPSRPRRGCMGSIDLRCSHVESAAQPPAREMTRASEVNLPVRKTTSLSSLEATGHGSGRLFIHLYDAESSSPACFDH